MFKPKRVEFPLFEIQSNPTISIKDITERRFDLIERLQPQPKFQRDFEELGFFMVRRPR